MSNPEIESIKEMISALSNSVDSLTVEVNLLKKEVQDLKEASGMPSKTTQ